MIKEWETLEGYYKIHIQNNKHYMKFVSKWANIKDYTIRLYNFHIDSNTRMMYYKTFDANNNEYIDNEISY